VFDQSFLAAAVQMTSTADLADNLDQAAHWVAAAAEAGATVVGLPENFPQLCERQDDTAAQAPHIYPHVQAWMADQARHHGLWLFGGTFAPGAGRVRNRLLVYGPDGGAVAHYDKRHLFDVALGGDDSIRESDVVEPGDAPAVADLGPCGQLGLSICYDLRFPEHFRALIDQGADWLTVPAAFARKTGRDHWQVLLQARAIENMSHVIAPAQCGKYHATRRTHGHALILDPWGRVLADAGDGPGLALATIDPTVQTEVRRMLPSLQHRRNRR
jgi:predicted amidohydrolase